MRSRDAGLGERIPDDAHRIQGVALRGVGLPREELTHQLAVAGGGTGAARRGAAGAAISAGITAGAGGPTMKVVMAAGCLSQVADVGELAALRRVGEILGKLIELVRRSRIAL